MALTRIRSGGLMDGQILNADIQDGAVTSAKLGTTAIADKLGFTPASPATVSAKQDALVSGTNIKTVNSSSLVGSGNIAVGDVTLSASQTLTNKTLSTGTVLGADVTGGDFIMTRTMLKDTGYKFYDSGASSALDYTNGSQQRWAPTGTVTLSVTNWPPTGNLGELLIEGVNLAAATISWPTVNWIKSDGTVTTTFSGNGVTLQSSGTDFVILWTRDAGTTIYGKIVR